MDVMWVQWHPDYHSTTHYIPLHRPTKERMEVLKDGKGD